jgi:hypothetical protein
MLSEEPRAEFCELGNTVVPVQGRIHIETVNEPFLFKDKGTPAEYGAGLISSRHRARLALTMHESGTFVTFHAGRHRDVRSTGEAL